jgi:hypothetical protein
MRCPHCGVFVMVNGLLRHIEETCQSETEIHPLSKWVSWSDVMGLEVSGSTLRRWVEYGNVRTRGERGAREYLLRDVTLRIAMLRKGG